MVRAKIYVGVLSEDTKVVPFERRVFKTICNPPSHITHPDFVYVIGPFRTIRGAKFCAAHPFAMCRNVEEFEQSAIVYQTQSELITDYKSHL